MLWGQIHSSKAVHSVNPCWARLMLHMINGVKGMQPLQVNEELSQKCMLVIIIHVTAVW